MIMHVLCICLARELRKYNINIFLKNLMYKREKLFDIQKNT